jgi:N-acetylmuramoyl-L-alanine amidase
LNRRKSGPFLVLRAGPSVVAAVLLAPLLVSPASQADRRVEIANLRYFTHAAFTRIVLDIGTLREYTTGELQGPGRIYIDVLQAKLNPLLEGRSYPVRTEYLRQIDVFQKSASTVRMTAEVDFAAVASYRVYHLFDPFRLVLDIYPAQSGRAAREEGGPLGEAGANPPPIKAKRPPEPLPSGYSMARQLGLGVRTIVIDPGHGGAQPGCIGRGGLQEKAITLDVALTLKRLLVEKAGLNVVLTRESDITVPLEDRTVVANQRRADLFVSIHANAHRDRSREGVETFFLNFSPDADVNETAARENATSTKNIGQMKDIIQQIVKNSKIVESRDLAEKIQRNLVQSLSASNPRVKSLGVKGGPFWVLIGGEMPSVLVEISHLSNAAEESRLATRRYRDLAAQGIYDGIMDYIHSLGKG